MKLLGRIARANCILTLGLLAAIGLAQKGLVGRDGALAIWSGAAGFALCAVLFVPFPEAKKC